MPQFYLLVKKVDLSAKWINVGQGCRRPRGMSVALSRYRWCSELASETKDKQ